MRRSAFAALACVLSLPSLLYAQSPQPAARFRAGIDLLTVQATVTGSDGLPVTDLKPGDFTVTVSGKPRKVLFARFYSADTSSAIVPGASGITAPGIPITVAPADNSVSAFGRIVVFLVDRESIRRGGELALLESAGRVTAALGPADASGALAIPGSSVTLTRDHAQVQTQLATMGGTMPPNTFRWFITWEEALGIESARVVPGWQAQRSQDNRLLQQVYDRECRHATEPITPGDPPRVAENCDNGVIQQAREMLLMARNHGRSVLAAITNLTTGLAKVKGPKHIVFLSGGLLFEQSMLAEFEQAARAANAAGIMLHTLHVDQPGSDASTEHRVLTEPFGSRELTTGLTTIAGMTGGSFSYAVARATGVFDRIATEITTSYELGLETEPADADGKPRDIDVAVTRPGVKVRARKQATLQPGGLSSASGAEAIAQLLQQPTDLSDLHISLGASTTRGDEASLLRVLLSAEIDAPQARSPIAWGFIVTRDGNVVANGRQVREPRDRPWAITASTKLAPGTYRVRFAAVDADGRAGVIDVPLAVGMHVAGPFQASDLLVGVVEGDRLQPATRVPQGADGAVLVELWSTEEEQLAKAAAVLEIYPAGSAEPVQRFRMALRSTPTGPGLMAEGHFRTTTLPPGRYTASVAPVVDDKPLARIIRVFEVIPKAGS